MAEVKAVQGSRAKKVCNSFVVKMLTTKPLPFKILQTLFCERRYGKPFQGMGEGYLQSK
jgi:hypothetical protein